MLSDALPLGIPHQGNLILQPLANLLKLPDRGQQLLPGGGKAHPGPVPDQQGEAHLFFQGVHHMGEARLGVPQAFGGSGEASQLHRRQQGLPLFCLHIDRSYPMTIIHNQNTTRRRFFQARTGKIRRIARQFAGLSP